MGGKVIWRKKQVTGYGMFVVAVEKCYILQSHKYLILLPKWILHVCFLSAISYSPPLFIMNVTVWIAKSAMIDLYGLCINAVRNFPIEEVP